MPTLTISEMQKIGISRRSQIFKSADSIIFEEQAKLASVEGFDIFLCHPYIDSDIVLGVKLHLEKLGYGVYVDWIEDKQLDRSSISPETASLLRRRMKQSKALFYVSTENSKISKWMPWECGYFDGVKGKAAILPLTQKPENHYSGQEYLSLYPYVVEALGSQSQKQRLWVHKSSSKYVLFESWLEGEEPTEH